ncbi:MAG: hypothetical protein J0L67_01715 [Cytophagales bacterium]|nr:hypothetical protein [Cytophagales bacterium]
MLFFCLIAPACFAQEQTNGIFATIKIDNKHRAKDYGRRVFNRSHREKFLIPDQPLIASIEFTSVSKITHDLPALLSYFDIIVSAEGMTRLRNAIAALPDTELVLLIDNTVFGRISSKSEQDFRYNKITIASPLKDVDLEWAHGKLEEMINARAK